MPADIPIPAPANWPQAAARPAGDQQPAEASAPQAAYCCSRDADADDSIPGHLAEDMQRTAYTGGWWYGLVCGLVAGGSTVGLLVWLVQLARAALECPQC